MLSKTYKKPSGELIFGQGETTLSWGETTLSWGEMTWGETDLGRNNPNSDQQPATTMKASNIKRGEGGGKTSIKFMANCPIPKLLTYNKFVSEVQKIDIGKVYSVKENLFSNDPDENVSGCYRDLREYLPCLAAFYLTMQNGQKDALKWFGETEGTFLVAFGGGWVPFWEERIRILIPYQFLKNVGKRVA